MATQPSNKNLETQIRAVKKEVHQNATDFHSFKKEMMDKLQVLHDFMIVQVDRQTFKNGSGKFNWNKIIPGLIAFLGTMALVLLGLVQLLDKVVK